MNAGAEHPEPQGSVEEEVPVCLHCLEPVHPLAHVCPHCGGAVGQLTPYMPFESIRWEAGIWGQMWRQAWRRDVSILGRLLRFLLIIGFVPILLVGLIPLAWRKLRGREKRSEPRS